MFGYEFWVTAGGGAITIGSKLVLVLVFETEDILDEDEEDDKDEDEDEEEEGDEVLRVIFNKEDELNDLFAIGGWDVVYRPDEPNKTNGSVVVFVLIFVDFDIFEVIFEELPK